jgi:hypothetical protein
MDIADLEAKLAQAQERQKQLWQASTEIGQTGILDVSGLHPSDWEIAREEVLSAERALALARGEETALACPWGPEWSGGAPVPHVVSSGYNTYLMYIIAEPDPSWDGTYIRVVDPGDEEIEPIALVEFISCYAFKFGGPNEDVFEGLSVSGKGLDGYGAYLIANSRWLAEQEKINSIHPHYDPAHWTKWKHYMLLFHHDMFECIAEDYKIEVFHDSFEHVLGIATRRVLRQD